MRCIILRGDSSAEIRQVHLPELETIHTHLIHEMEGSLRVLAAHWRGSQNQPEAPEIVRRYQSILRCMIELGYHDSLDVESELPDEFLPQEYFDLFKP